jgi:ferredoxin
MPDNAPTSKSRQGRRGAVDGQVKETNMPHVIDADVCISCGACADVCPEEAISEGDGAYVIDAEKCSDCATCVDECPESAIAPAE